MRENHPDKKSSWEDGIIRKLLLTIIVADPKRLNRRKKPMIYTKAFVEIYNWQKERLIYETYKMVKFEKYSISEVENPLNLNS